MDSWKFKFWREFVSHHHRWQIFLFFFAGIKRNVRAEQQHAIDLFSDNEVNEGFFLLLLLSAVA